MTNKLTDSSRFDRRRFLRATGALVALPALESLGAGVSVAAGAATGQPLGPTTATGAPLRTAFLSFPNGVIPAAWKPNGFGPDFTFGPTLGPLEPVRGMVQVLSGLDLAAAEHGGDGAGDHARGNGTFLTAVRLNKSATDIRAGVSIDQEIAARLGRSTRFPSIELTGDHAINSGECDSGYSCAYQYNISWKSQDTPMTGESNPRLVFERLFGPGPHGQRNANLERRRAEQRSVLDFVLDEARSLSRRSGPADRQKLDQYLGAVREIERRIESSERLGVLPDPDASTPVGISQDYEEYLTQMFDLLVLAFQTDSTRVATFQIAHDGSNRSFEQIGIVEGHHELTHHRDRQEMIDKVQQIDRWYVQQFSRFLQRLDATTDSDGKSLLYNSQIVYGSGNADGNRHSHRDLPILFAGAGGGAYQPGKHVDCGSTPLANLYLRMAQTAGVGDLTRFADSTAPLSKI